VHDTTEQSVNHIFFLSVVVLYSKLYCDRAQRVDVTTSGILETYRAGVRYHKLLQGNSTCFNTYSHLLLQGHTFSGRMCIWLAKQLLETQTHLHSRDPHVYWRYRVIKRVSVHLMITTQSSGAQTFFITLYNGRWKPV